MNEITAFQRDCLYVIGGHGNPSGSSVKEALDAYYEAEVHHGRLYPNLDALVDAGLIEKGQKDDRTNEYRLTDEGRDLIVDRRQWENGCTIDFSY